MLKWLDFVAYVLPELLEDVPLNVRQRMYFQNDGAPAHFSIALRNHLRAKFGNRWIGRGGPMAWPPGSPDLTYLDFFLWGHMNQLAYEIVVETEEDLVVIGMLTTVWKRLLTLLLILDPTIRQTVMKGMLYYNIVSMFRACFPAC